LGEGVKSMGSIGSSVIVGRMVGVRVGCGVFVTSGVPVDGVDVGMEVFSTKRLGVLVGSSENGVAVNGDGCSACAGVGVPRNGISNGNPVQPERSKTMTEMRTDFFIIPLR
jgi:hypothetical protein